MDIAFDHETKQNVIKLAANEEALLRLSLVTANWFTHDDDIAKFAESLRSQLVKED